MAPVPMTPRDGNLGEISERLMGRTSSCRIGLLSRCHRAPQRTLEQDYLMSSKVLGTGYSGSVRLATAKRGNTKAPVAVKTFRLKNLDASKKARLQSEIEIFLCMDHPHVARLWDVYETDAQINIVMECMEGGELFDRVAKVKAFSESDAADATRQILLALAYVHSHGMVHRDLKLENFLYDLQGGKHLKMIDFGFSKYIDNNARMKTSCGTLAYVAPEVLKRSYTSQCDLWSMGVIVFILLSGRMPFHGNSDEQVKDIKQGKFEFKPQYWKNISEDAKEFVQLLLEVDPTRRMNATAALKHKWMSQNYNKVKVEVDESVINAIRCWGAAPKLQRACYSMMAWALTNRQQSYVRDYFLALDTDHDGAISSAELKAAMRGKLQMPDEETQKVFRLLSDAEIHYSDFLAAMICSCFGGLSIDDDLLRSTFAKFDTNDSGFITSNGLRGILGETFEGEDIDALVSDADYNKDGKINYQEFSSYTRRFHPGTLLLKSGSTFKSGSTLLAKEDLSFDKETRAETKETHVIELAPAAGPHQPCCTLQ